MQKQKQKINKIVREITKTKCIINYLKTMKAAICGCNCIQREKQNLGV